MSDIQIPLTFTDAAANKVKSLIEGEDNPNLRLRVYITGGGYTEGLDGSRFVVHNPNASSTCGCGSSFSI